MGASQSDPGFIHGPDPLVSVVMPTFNRPWLLCRAIESVRAQTETRWELIISDDESRPAAGRWIADSYAALDPRIRVVTNAGPHGQSGNLNNAMAHARAAWIKPLFDDDVLGPDCLRAMLQAVHGRPGVVLARCLAHHYRDERLRRVHRLGALPVLQRLESGSARLAMLLQDVEIGMPTQALIRAEAVRDGLVMERPDWLVVGVDQWWFARLLQQGDLLLINLPLVEEHQGTHSTVTSSASTDLIYDEMRRLRRELRPLIPADLRPRNSRAAEGVVSLVQAATDARARRFGPALRRALSVRSPGAWLLTARLLLRRRFPGRFEGVARERIVPPPGLVPRARTADMLNPECPPVLSASPN